MKDKQGQNSGMSRLRETVSSMAGKVFDEVVAIRRHLHQHPELSFHEFETSRYILRKLHEYGIRGRQVADTGIVAKIEGNPGSAGKKIALRSELDGLPVNEETGLSFSSVNPGVMHACGHDVHTACLLGTARILMELRKEFAGTVYLVFQPGEECIPGGAKKMIDEDIFEGENPDLIVAQHVLPELEAGQVGIRPGMYMASGDEIYITLSGSGGHGALPHTTVDTVAAISQVVVSLQQVASRFAPPHIPTVLSFGKLIAGGSTNVIPREAVLEGTFRTMDETWRAKAHERITSIATQVSSGLGADCSVEIRKGYPVLFNDPAGTNLVGDFMSRYLGRDKVKELPLRMTTEDFAWFAARYPAVFYRLGTGMPGKMLHSPVFDVDETVMETGTGVLAWIAISFLNQQENGG